MERSDILHAVVVILLIGLYLAALAAINRCPATQSPSSDVSLPSVLPPEDLSTELRRCNALGPQYTNENAEEARCRAVWEENHRRFFGRPARPLTPPAAPAPFMPGAAGADTSQAASPKAPASSVVGGAQP